MAKIRFNAASAVAKLSSDIKLAIQGGQLESDMGNVIVKRVAFEARRGIPLNDFRRFPPLKPGTIKRRQQIGDANQTHPAFSPERSNLTITGQLIDALSFKRVRDLTFSLFVDDTTRTPYRGQGRVETKTDAQVDDELRKGVGEDRRRFALFTAAGIKKEGNIIDRITELIKAELKRRL